MSTESRKASRSYDYYNPDNPSRTIILSGDVDDDSVYYVIELIALINEFDDENEENVKEFVRKPIKLIVNSFGGSVYDGFAIIGMIETSKTPIHTYCYGSAMSMAFLIFVSGHYRYIHRLATLMYHECTDEPMMNKLTTLRESIDETKRIMDVYDKHLLAKTTLKKKQLDDTKKGKFDWYMNPEMGLKYGIADEII